MCLAPRLLEAIGNVVRVHPDTLFPVIDTIVARDSITLTFRHRRSRCTSSNQQAAHHKECRRSLQRPDGTKREKKRGDRPGDIKGSFLADLHRQDSLVPACQVQLLSKIRSKSGLRVSGLDNSRETRCQVPLMTLPTPIMVTKSPRAAEESNLDQRDGDVSWQVQDPVHTERAAF